MTVTLGDDCDVDPDAPIDPWIEVGFTDAELEEWLGAPNPTEVPGLNEPWMSSSSSRRSTMMTIPGLGWRWWRRVRCAA